MFDTVLATLVTQARDKVGKLDALWGSQLDENKALRVCVAELEKTIAKHEKLTAKLIRRQQQSESNHVKIQEQFKSTLPPAILNKLRLSGSNAGVDALIADLTEATAKLYQDEESRIAELNGELDTMQSQMATLKRERREMEAETTKLERHRKELTGEVRRVRDELAEQKAQREAAETELHKGKSALRWMRAMRRSQEL